MPKTLHSALIITYQDETQEILKHFKENEEIIDIKSDGEDLNEEEQKENERQMFLLTLFVLSQK